MPEVATLSPHPPPSRWGLSIHPTPYTIHSTPSQSCMVAWLPPLLCHIIERDSFPSTSRMLPTSHRHQFLEESLPFRLQCFGLYLLNLELCPVQSLIMLIGEMTCFENMSFESFVICEPLFSVLFSKSNIKGSISITSFDSLCVISLLCYDGACTAKYRDCPEFKSFIEHHLQYNFVRTICFHKHVFKYFRIISFIL